MRPISPISSAPLSKGLKRLLISLCAAAAVQGSAAQTATDRQGYLGLGSVTILDTYLSQEKFDGVGISLLQETFSLKADRHWGTLRASQLSLADAEDRAGNDSMVEGSFAYCWGRLRQWQPFSDSELLVEMGLAGRLTAGFLYDTRNSNNPAQARLSLSLMPTARARYHFTLLGQQIVARAEVMLPLCGLMFSPNYGQSYYEIFTLSDYDRNIVATTFASAPDLQAVAALHWQASKRLALSLGYLEQHEQSNVNNIKRHIARHQLLIGVSYSLNK